MSGAGPAKQKRVGGPHAGEDPPPGAPSSTRQRVFVGDVQGCDDELGDLLDALAFDPATQELWFVGDLVNRGPASLAALRRVRAIAAGSVLGNHDLHLLGLAWGTRALRPGDTLAPVLEAPDAAELIDWLAEQPLVHAWSDLILVHAGLHPAWSDPLAVARRLETRIRERTIPWDDPELQFLTRVRYCDRHGQRPARDADPGPHYAPWDSFYRGERRVVFGHWSQRGLVKTDRVRGLDTGCVWGGRLTAWLAEEDRFVSVPARRGYQTPGA